MTGLEKVTLANRYFLKELVGIEGMAQVYRAWDQLRSDDIAIKVIHEIRYFESFLREAVALRNLAHPNIVRFYNVEKDDGKGIIFIVMDWIDGKDLQSILKKRGSPLGVPEVTSILECVHSALHFAHNLNFCHCDIKPSNILLRNSDNETILSDFGLAHISDEQGVGGTLPYMAPELFKGGTISVASDIYALGVTLYQLLSGRLPFWGTTREQIIQEHINKRPPPIQRLNRKIPNGIVAVIEKSLRKNPNQRQKTVTELWIDYLKFTNRENIKQSNCNSILYGRKGEITGKKIKLFGDKITIGRSKSNQLRLNHPSVSRFHAVLIWENRRLYIRDMRSKVGTYVNSYRIPPNKAILLRNGDIIRIGISEVFELSNKK